MKNTIGLIAILATLLVAQAHSDQMFRCVEPSGHVTFVQHRCPDTALDYNMIDVNNLPPSGAGTPAQMADPAILDKQQSVKVTIVNSAPEAKSFSGNTTTQSNIESRRAARNQRIESRRQAVSD